MTRLFALITLCVAALAPAYAAEDVVEMEEVEEVPIEGESGDCYLWAKSKECDTNFSYMNVHCRKTCEKFWVIDPVIKDVKSIFEMTTQDIDGKEFKFEELRGKTTVIVNVASKCGYAEFHYKEMVGLYNRYKDTGKFEILAFPSNQFEDEPGDLPEIKEFAQQRKVEFKMMTKIDVNYETADPIYRYMKYLAGPQIIDWNYTTYYIISPDGTVTAYNRGTPKDLDEPIKAILFPDGIPEDAPVKDFPEEKQPNKNLKEVLGIEEEEDDEVTKEL